MKKKIIVISLGGSVILEDDEKRHFIKSLRNTLKSFYKTHKFAIVCGGGSIAREYQKILKEERTNEKQLSLAGIRATRMNAELIMQFFDKEANSKLPLTMKQVKEDLEKNHIVVCGALRFAPHQTSDSTAAELASYLKAPFINITNVRGLYTSDPRKNKNAKLIPYQTWQDFEKTAYQINFKPGQHFVLDQKASTIIRKNRIPLYIINNDTKNLSSLLKGKKFIGTMVGPQTY